MTYVIAWDCSYDRPRFRWDEERRFLLRCELDAAFLHLYLPAETNGVWRPAVGVTAEDLARLKASFPTPRDAVGTEKAPGICHSIAFPGPCSIGTAMCSFARRKSIAGPRI